MSPGHILMVCSANVCRSPLAQLTLATRLADAGVDDIVIDSAAARPTDSDRICEAVRTRHDGDKWRRMAERHSAQGVDREQLQRSEIVLVASRDARARLAQLDPTSRWHTFTMTETAWLTKDFVADRGRRGSGLLDDLARHMDRQRGMRGPAPSHPLVARLHAAPDPLTVPDGHLTGGSAHRRCQAQVEELITKFGRLLIPR